MAESPKFKFHTMIRVRALDEVEGTNGEVNYRLLLGSSGVFEIEENTGQISLFRVSSTGGGVGEASPPPESLTSPPNNFLIKHSNIMNIYLNCVF